jgi:hypothetical protein
MNLRRGFHRIFVILWVLYAAAVVLFLPLYEGNKEMDSAISLIADRYMSCMDARRNQGGTFDDNYKFSLVSG